MKNKIKTIIISFILLLLLIAYLYPVYLIVLNSFKPFKEIFESFIAFPKELYIKNYITAFTATDLGLSLKNNLILTVLTVTGVILFTSMAGYKLSRNKSRLSWVFYILFTMPFLIPFYTYMIPLVKLASSIHIMNSIAGLSLINISTSSFAIFMFHGFVKGIPVELDESAKIDGCSELALFFKVIFPLLKPVVSSVTILFSIWTWNDFLLPFLILNNKESQTITINVYKMFGKFGSEWDIVMANLVLSSLPIVILYIVLQKYIISGIVAGAIKG